jgi:hypothetical protein
MVLLGQDSVLVTMTAKERNHGNNLGIKIEEVDLTREATIRPLLRTRKPWGLFS